jgi:hypothetical protein
VVALGYTRCAYGVRLELIAAHLEDTPGFVSAVLEHCAKGFD